MQHSVLDPCLFYVHDSPLDDEAKQCILDGIQAVLVDDTLGTGSPQFEELEKGVERVFETKERSYLPFKFNGSHLDLMKTENDECDAILQQQYDYGKSITVLTDNYTSDEFATKRGMIAYVATSTRPDVFFHAAKLTQALSTSITKEDVSLLRDAVRLLQEPKEIIFRHIDLQSISIVGYSDASFAGNSDHSSQLGMIVLLKDETGVAAIIHYGSWKCRRVTRSILAAKVHAFVSCLDYCVTLAYDLKNMIGKALKVSLDD